MGHRQLWAGGELERKHTGLGAFPRSGDGIPHATLRETCSSLRALGQNHWKVFAVCQSASHLSCLASSEVGLNPPRLPKGSSPIGRCTQGQDKPLRCGSRICRNHRQGTLERERERERAHPHTRIPRPGHDGRRRAHPKELFYRRMDGDRATWGCTNWIPRLGTGTHMPSLLPFSRIFRQCGWLEEIDNVAAAELRTSPSPHGRKS